VIDRVLTPPIRLLSRLQEAFVRVHIVDWTGIVKTLAVCSDAAMSQPSTRPTLYKGYRFAAEIISRCVWLYYRFGVSLRDVSEWMLARGIESLTKPFACGRCGSARSTPGD
jgi:hypothetical protein